MPNTAPSSREDRESRPQLDTLMSQAASARDFLEAYRDKAVADYSADTQADTAAQSRWLGEVLIPRLLGILGPVDPVLTPDQMSRLKIQLGILAAASVPAGQPAEKIMQLDIALSQVVLFLQNLAIYQQNERLLAASERARTDDTSAQSRGRTGALLS